MEWRTADANELRSFIRDHMLPRLDRLENEVQILRAVCWPVCQSLRENGHQLTDINNKIIFLSTLHPDDADKLLKEKAKLTRSMKLGGSNCIEEERRLVIKSKNF
jgi:hypothetical protein